MSEPAKALAWLISFCETEEALDGIGRAVVSARDNNIVPPDEIRELIRMGRERREKIRSKDGGKEVQASSSVVRQ